MIVETFSCGSASAASLNFDSNCACFSMTVNTSFIHVMFYNGLKLIEIRRRTFSSTWYGQCRCHLSRWIWLLLSADSRRRRYNSDDSSVTLIMPFMYVHVLVCIFCAFALDGVMNESGLHFQICILYSKG
jgi:hypothetical protein